MPAADASMSLLVISGAAPTYVDHVHIFEDKSSDQEAMIVCKWIKGLLTIDEPRRTGRDGEALEQVDRRPSRSRATQSRPQGYDVALLVASKLVCDVPHHRAGERRLVPASDRAERPGAGGQIIRQTTASRGMKVVFRAQILGVEREVRNSDVVNRLRFCLASFHRCSEDGSAHKPKTNAFHERPATGLHIDVRRVEIIIVDDDVRRPFDAGRK